MLQILVLEQLNQGAEFRRCWLQVDFLKLLAEFPPQKGEVCHLLGLASLVMVLRFLIDPQLQAAGKADVVAIWLIA